MPRIDSKSRFFTKIESKLEQSYHNNTTFRHFKQVGNMIYVRKTILKSADTPLAECLAESDAAAGSSCMKRSPTLRVSHIDIGTSIKQHVKHRLRVIYTALHTITAQYCCYTVMLYVQIHQNITFILLFLFCFGNHCSNTGKHSFRRRQQRLPKCQQ